jgi:hypothetical protein
MLPIIFNGHFPVCFCSLASAIMLLYNMFFQSLTWDVNELEGDYGKGSKRSISLILLTLGSFLQLHPLK